MSRLEDLLNEKFPVWQGMTPSKYRDAKLERQAFTEGYYASNKEETPKNELSVLELANDLINRTALLRSLLLKQDQDSEAAFASTGALSQLQTVYQFLNRDADKSKP